MPSAPTRISRSGSRSALLRPPTPTAASSRRPSLEGSTTPTDTQREVSRSPRTTRVAKTGCLTRSAVVDEDGLLTELVLEVAAISVWRRVVDARGRTTGRDVVVFHREDGLIAHTTPVCRHRPTSSSWQAGSGL